MNVTPLIDVLLVLLVIFMIITPMDPHGLYPAVPQKDGKAAPPDAPIVLQVTQVKNAAGQHSPLTSSRWFGVSYLLGSLKSTNPVPMESCSLKGIQRSISSTVQRQSTLLTMPT